jgi:DNA-binding FrmR family transcriptional regulator
MLSRINFLRRRVGAPPPTRPVNEDLKNILRDQDELVGLNVSIEDSKEALRKGRDAVGQAVLGASAQQAGDNGAVAMLQASRQGILQQIAAVSQAARQISFDAISAHVLADQLHSELIRLTTSVPEDRLAAKSLEIQIQTALRSYSNSIHRLLTPLTFR